MAAEDPFEVYLGHARKRIHQTENIRREPIYNPRGANKLVTRISRQMQTHPELWELIDEMSPQELSCLERRVELALKGQEALSDEEIETFIKKCKELID